MFPKLKLVCKYVAVVQILSSIYVTPAFSQSKWATPAQVEGPYYPRIKPKEIDSNLLEFEGKGLPDGEPLQLKGRIFDQNGLLIEGAKIEIWQSDNNGIYKHHKAPNHNKFDARFQGFGSFITKKDGRYNFLTLVPVPDHKRPPHIHVKIFRSEKEILTTQLYIKDHPENNRDGLLSLMLYPGQHKLLIDLKQAAIKPGLNGKVGIFDFVISKNF